MLTDVNLKSISIQIYSDLHLELQSRIPEITPTSPYLFLAGDISRFGHSSFNEFLNYCSKNWEKVFYVFGNHDYWSKNSYIQKIKREANSYLRNNKLTNIFILDNEFVSLNDEIVVYGSTFWTPSPFSSKSEAQNMINDYNMIRVKWYVENLFPRYITPHDINTMSNECFDKMFDFLNSNELTKGKKVIVITHFPPQRTNTSHSKYLNQPAFLKSYFAHSDDTIEKLGDVSNVVCWISGHTHCSYDFVSDKGVRLISNQMGYLSECLSGESKFLETGLFEIDLE